MQLIVLFFWLLSFSSCTNQKKIILNIDSKYRGWVYLISSKVPIQDKYEVSSRNSGIIYISDSLYSKGINTEVLITVDDSITSNMTLRSYDEVFYPERSDLAIVFKKFYFPLTISEKRETLYKYKQGDINFRMIGEFQYYYLTGVIDTSIVRRWKQ